MFTVELHWVILAIFVIATLVFLVVDPPLREWQHRRRKRKAAAVLKAEFERRQREFELEQNLKGVTWDRDALLQEVRQLTQRNRLMANELRADDFSKTQVLRPSAPGRFTKKSS